MNGKYYNNETDTEIEIKNLQNSAYSITKNGRVRDGQLIVKDFLRMNSYGISIIRDNENNIKGLSVNNGRIENVKFVKSKKG